MHLTALRARQLTSLIILTPPVLLKAPPMVSAIWTHSIVGSTLSTVSTPHGDSTVSSVSTASAVNDINATSNIRALMMKHQAMLIYCLVKYSMMESHFLLEVHWNAFWRHAHTQHLLNHSLTCTASTSSLLHTPFHHQC